MAMDLERPSGLSFKIIFSYLLLALLGAVAAYFIYSEIQAYASSEVLEKNDGRLLRTGEFLTDIYQAENLSKLALHTQRKADFDNYVQKVDSLYGTIDTLKNGTDMFRQKVVLDSIKALLQQKVSNSQELARLRRVSEEGRSLDSVIEEFKKMESSLGRITPESFVPNFESLSPQTQQTVRDYVAYLNKNIPKSKDSSDYREQTDSILEASKTLLANARNGVVHAQRNRNAKERELLRADLDLSQKLQRIMATVGQEINQDTYANEQRKQEALTHSIRLAGLAALAGLLVVGIFTFLINRDFWRIQVYRRKLEKEKKYSESLLKSREQLISTVSHDLRSPLNTIAGYADLVAQNSQDARNREYVEHIRPAVGYMERLVNDLLDFSKLEAGKLTLEQSPFNLYRLLVDAARDAQKMYGKPEVDLVLDVSEELKATMQGDAHRITQVVNNLLGNAFKFTQDGTVKLTARLNKTAKEHWAWIQVSDTGIGIPKEKQKEIFSEFSQVPDQGGKKYGGYGLGLTISKKLVGLLGGQLRVQSEPGKGSAFTVELPVQFAAEQTVTQETPETALGETTGLGILFVDDDSGMLRLLADMCGSMGIQAHTFSDYRDIPQKASSLHYDVVVTDFQMPGTSGKEVMERLRSGAYEHYGEQAVLVMTGARDTATATFLQMGFDAVLRKPFTREQFVWTLRQLGLLRNTVAEQLDVAVPDSGSKLFGLEGVAAFVGHDLEAILELLETFHIDTEHHMALLEENLRHGEMEAMGQLAHRMLPMFRQLQAGEPTIFLAQMELWNQHTDPKLAKTVFWELKKHMVPLLLAIQRFLAKRPSRID